MGRWLTVCGILGLVIAGLVFLAVGLPQSGGGGDPESSDPAPNAPAPRQAKAAQRSQPAATSGPSVEIHNLPGVRGPLVIPGCRLVVMDRQEVPALRDGQLLFIATEPEPGEEIPENRTVEVEMRYLVTRVKPGEEVPASEIITVPNMAGVKYRRIKEGETVDAADLEIITQRQRLRRLAVGDRVKEGQLLALVDPRVAFDDLGIKKARVIASRADHEAAEMTAAEALSRYERQMKLYNSPGGRATPLEEVTGAKLTWDRYRFEAISKRQAITLGVHELKQAQTLLEMHAIRSKINGVIKAIYKNRGDAVKNLDPVLLIQDPDRLRVEGLVEVQHARYLEPGMEAVVEPSKPEKPELVLRGHMQEVTSVAVSPAKDALILSGSEDRTVRIWDRAEGKQLYTLRGFPAAVRAVACTADGDRSLGMAGVADGSVWLLRGFDRATPPVLQQLNGRHRGPVTCAAFSPEGTLLATGGEDHLIRLWDAASGELLNTSPAEQGHRGAVTSLHFASNTELVSAGRGDNAVLVWKLGPGAALSRIAEFPRRSGDVANLGVSPDGKRVLFDQGKDLQVLSLQTGQIEGVLQNASPAMHFSTMALFAPKDGKVILTASAAENRLQLYRAPTATLRAAEIRQLVWPAAPATCGAFAPNGQFLVTGMRDLTVLVWQMPDPKEVDQELKARITLVDRSLDSSTRQVRIAAELTNPGYLLPGDTATLVIEPKK
ncbi:MAG TPA: HlyD family efflux transporter periplasmic adaptor subunit [Gemmataceae bacterium]|nr:HlyD family efflux transporter periplasmic adaptor subunit [Gemmataceae bacterium]